jgi:hypothetical protein
VANTQKNWEDEELDSAYTKLTGSHPSINNEGCGCLPFITLVLVALIVLFLLIAGIALLMNS